LILIKLVFLALSGLFFLAVTATALGAFLVLTGAPQPCIDRAVTPAPPPDAALQANWDGILATTGTGEAFALSVTEDQATTLAQGHLEGKDVPVDDLQVFFCPDGTTEALGKVGFLGLSSDVLVKGTLDTQRRPARVELDSVKLGNLPSWVAESVLDAISEGEEARTLPTNLDLQSMQVGDGEAIVVLGP
jgi:hypothetical protein